MSDYTARKIRYYRKTKHLTQKQLAEACDGISFTSIRRYETEGGGNHDPKITDLQKIAKALDVNVSMFIEDGIVEIKEVAREPIKEAVYIVYHCPRCNGSVGSADSHTGVKRMENYCPSCGQHLIGLSEMTDQ